MIDPDHDPSDPAILALPESMRPIVPVSTARLIGSLRAGERPELDDGGREAAVESLDRVTAAIQYCVSGSGPVEVMTILEMIATTVQTELPEEHGLGVYLQLLQPLPPHVLKLAAIEVLSTHTLRVMPLPAEILNARIVGDWRAVVVWWAKMQPHWQRQLGVV